MEETLLCIDCDRGVVARGRCNTHCKSATVEDTLRWYGWTVTDAGCWEFNGPRTKRGYGRIRVQGRNTMVHRLAYETWTAAIPDDLLVRHTCDNPPCINPKHLMVGTQADNMQDMRGRNRHSDVSGERNPRAKLSWSEIGELRELHASGRVSNVELSVMFDVVPSVVSGITSGKLWVEKRRHADSKF